MTKKEYAEYEAVVAEFMEREGLRHLTTVSQEEGLTEPYFSKGPCDCCGTGIGGNYYDCNGVTDGGKVEEFSVCEDCVYYAEYRHLDDTTMDEIKRSPD